MAIDLIHSIDALVRISRIEFFGMALGLLGVILGSIAALIPSLFTGEPTQPSGTIDKDPQ